MHLRLEMENGLNNSAIPLKKNVYILEVLFDPQLSPNLQDKLGRHSFS